MAIAGGLVGPVEDPDFWWHVRTGRWILDHGRLPSHDLFTYTVPGHAWTDHEWLSEVAMWLVYRAGGLGAISIGFGLVTLLGFLLIWRTADRPVDGVRPAYVVLGLGLALGAVAGAPIWGPRAQMITFLFACLELFWLRRYLDGRSRAITWFPLLMVAWANLHGGWAIGLGFLAVAFLDSLIGWALDPSQPAHRMRMRRLALVGTLSLGAVLLTPHGPALLLYPFQTQGSAAQQRLIVEWFSPDFHNSALRGFEAMILLLLAGFALRRPSRYEVLLTLLVLAMALQSVRHIALFVAATTPIVIGTWSAIWAEQARARGWRLGGSGTPSPALAGLTVVALAAIAVLIGWRADQGLARQDAVSRATFPVGAVAWLQAHPEVGTRVYNQYGWGGYLVFSLYPQPQRRVFIFGEAALMGDDLLNEYQDVSALRAGWERTLDRRQVDYVVYDRGQALANVLATQPGWRLAYQDANSVVYVRA